MTKTGDAATPTLEFDDHADSAMEWASAHVRQIAIGGIVAVALVGALYLWRAADEKKEANAGRALGDAQRSFVSGNYPLAQSDLQKVVQRYDGTMAGKEARLLLAQVYFEEKKVDEGLKQLDAISGAGPFEASVHALRGAGLEQTAKNAEAAAEYLKASTAAISDQDRASYKADAARAYRAAGQKEEALKIWKSLAEDESNPLGGEAKLRIGELTATPASS